MGMAAKQQVWEEQRAAKETAAGRDGTMNMDLVTIATDRTNKARCQCGQYAFVSLLQDTLLKDTALPAAYLPQPHAVREDAPRVGRVPEAHQALHHEAYPLDLEEGSGLMI